MTTACPSCSTPTPNGAAFCPSCGLRVSGPYLNRVAAGSPAPNIRAGQLIGARYRVAARIASGAMGEVWRGSDERLHNRPCAIKTILLGGATPEEHAERAAWFAREVEVLATMRHPAICDIRDVVAEGSSQYLILELIEGHTLADELAARGAPGLPERDVLAWAATLCDAISYLHGQSPPVIFRDLKPHNIMLRPDGRVTLIDFGIARHIAPAGGTAIGTGGYAAPEQYQGLADARSDVYALAATLHHVLTGRDPATQLPFSFPLVRTLAPTISKSVDAALARALDLDPAKRYRSTQEFAVALGVSDSRRRPPLHPPMPGGVTSSIKDIAQNAQQLIDSSTHVAQQQVKSRMEKYAKARNEAAEQARKQREDEAERTRKQREDEAERARKQREDEAERARKQQELDAAAERARQYAQKVRSLVRDDTLCRHLLHAQEPIHYSAVWGDREIVLGERFMYVQTRLQGVWQIKRGEIAGIEARGHGVMNRRWEVTISTRHQLSAALATVMDETLAHWIVSTIRDWNDGKSIP